MASTKPPKLLLTLFLPLLFTLLTLSQVHAQSRYYEIYFDADNSQLSGCTINHTNLANIYGIDAKITITTDSQATPVVTSSNWQKCNGSTFVAQDDISSALGFDTGANAEDVFEARIAKALLADNPSQNTQVYFATTTSAAEDVVLSNIVIDLSNSIEIIPVIGFFGLLLLLILILLIARKKLPKIQSVMIYLLLISPIVWALTIYIDGQTDDWANLLPSVIDPVGDTSQVGDYADITSVYAKTDKDNLYLRMDIVELQTPIQGNEPTALSQNATLAEDNTQSIQLIGDDTDTATIDFIISSGPIHGTLSQMTRVDGHKMELSYTPNSDYNGNDSFQFQTNDGNTSSAAAQVSLTITPVNDQPSFNASNAITVANNQLDYQQQWANNLDKGASNESTQTLSFTILTNDNPQAFSTQPSISTNGFLSFTVVGNNSSTAHLTIVLKDNGGIASGGIDTSIVHNLTISKNFINNPPSFTIGTNPTVLEDSSNQTITNWASNISAGSNEEAGQTLTFIISNNNNPSLFASQPILDAQSGDLSFTSADDANGSAEISIYLQDDGGTANGGNDTSNTQTFTITVTPVNDGPTFDLSGNVELLENAPTFSQTWTSNQSAGPIDETTQNLSFTITNSNNSLFSQTPTIDNTGLITFTPLANTSGSSIISITLHDDGGTANGGIDTSVIKQFIVTVGAVNSPPEFTPGPNQSVLEDSGSHTISNWATNIIPGPADEVGQGLIFHIINNTDPTLFSSQPTIDANTGNLSYATASDAFGIAEITIVLQDDAGTADGGIDTSTPKIFTITLIPVNDQPTFSADADITIDEDFGQYSQQWATNLYQGADNETTQQLNLVINTNNNPSLFTTQPQLDATGQLTFSTFSNAIGTAQLSINLADDGGTANGGIDTSINYDLNITVTPINDPPVIISTPTLTIDTCGADYSYDVNAIDADSGDIITYSLITAFTGMSIDGTTGLLIWNAANLQIGTHAISVQATDLALANDTQSYDLVVTECNQPPEITSIPTQSVNEFETYNYDVDAIDPNVSDVLDYSIVYSPNNSTINNLIGTVDSSLESSVLVQTVRTKNNTCKLPPPTISSFDPVIKWVWNDVAVLSQPMVAPLTDTNNDGVINTDDDIAIVFVQWTGDCGGSSDIYAIDGKTGTNLWNTSSQIHRVGSGSHVSIADLDNDGIPEIIASGNTEGTIVFDNTGNIKWSSLYPTPVSCYRYGAPTVADLDGDGFAEIINKGVVLEHDGVLRFQHQPSLWNAIVDVAADINNDGYLEILSGKSVFDYNGNKLFDLPNGEEARTFAVLDIDNDGVSELAYVTTRNIAVIDNTGTTLWSKPYRNYNSTPLTVGDIDGDGTIELVGLLGGAIRAIDVNTGNEKWVSIVSDGSHATGLVMFDFDYDGKLEVVFNDQQYLRVYDGETGDVRYTIPNPSATASESPTIADVDSDGHAEIIVSGNRGIKVIEDANDSWIATRKIWNQYAYNINNINDDLSVPTHPVKSWQTHNTYRLNTFPDRNPLGLVDLALFDLTLNETDTETSISLQVTNRGLTPSESQSTVNIYNGNPSLDGSLLGSLSVPVLARSEKITLTLHNIIPSAITTNLYARIDESNQIDECIENNNSTSAALLEVQATDPLGLYDTQRFSVYIENINQAPTLSDTPLTNATTRLVYNQQITATDPDIGDGLIYELISPPAGLTINKISGNLNWIPNQDQIGTHTITVKVTDLGGLTDTKDLSLEVIANEQNRNPYIISAPIVTAKVDALYSYQVQGYDPDGDVIDFRLLQSPTGMSIDATTDTIQWTPTLSEVGEHEIILEVHDALGAKGQQTYRLHVFQYDINNPQNQAPVITSTPVFDAEQNKPYSYQIQATDPDGDTLIYAKVAGPDEMSVDGNNGLLTWIPITFGEQTVSISVSDGQYTSVQQWTLNIIQQGTNPNNTAPFISSTPQFDVLVDTNYNYQVIAVDFDADPISYQLNQSPTGMTISSTGLIQWQANTSQIGQNPIIIQVSDDRGAHTTQSYEITVNTQNSINHSPQITSAPTNTHPLGSLYSYTIVATDIDGDSLSYNLVSAPTGMTLDTNTNTIQWNPTTAGSYTIALSVADQQYIVTQQWILTITDGSNTINLAPSILSAPNQNAEVNTSYNYTVIANDPEADPLTYQLLQAPTGMTISTTGQIIWQVNATQVGTQAVTIRVFDDHTNYSEQSFDINVTDPNNGNNQNHAPTINSLPTYIIQKGDIYSYQIQATDSDGDALNYNKITGPNDMVLNTITNALSWQASQVGDYNIGITVADQQYTVAQNWILRVVESDLGLNSNLHITPQAAVVNQPVEIFVQPQGGIGNITVTATLDNQPLILDANLHATKTFASEGTYIVQAHITDDLETITLEKTITVSDTLDLFAPEIDIHSPTDGSIATGFIDFNISVNDPNISQWHLGYRTAEAGENAPRTQIASGTNNIDHQDVVNFDTSQLRNGIFVFVLDAIDIYGQSISVAHSIFIEGDLKIGNFQIAFEDLSIPVAGIPVTITRSYDTRNRNADEAFGKGWEIGYQSLQLTESRIPGLGWYMSTEFYYFGPVRLPRYCFEPIGERLVSIRMPDDTLEKFKVKAKTLNTAADGRINCQDITPPDAFTIEFEPQGDTNSQLTAQGANASYVVRNGNIEPLGDLEIYNPNKYTLILLDGTIYSIDQGFNLTGIETSDGNSIQFTHNGIVHNNGYSVTFIRDSQGRITSIVKPNGDSINYSYDVNENLASHTDLNGNTTTFTYILDHYLEEINDPRGIMAARNEYDNDGRLIAHIDANGNRIEYTHDIAGRTETIKDRNGNSSIFVYDNAGLVLAQTNAEQETTYHEYNDIYLETKRIDPLGHETIWTYDNAGNQLTETDHQSHTTTSTYNFKGEIETQKDANDEFVIQNTYNPDYDPQQSGSPQHGYGQLKTVEDALGHTTQFHWLSGLTSPSPSGRSVSVNTGFTDANGKRYDVTPLTNGIQNGLSGTTTDLNGLKTQSTYDDEARPLTQEQIITDVNDNEIARYITKFEYNDNGDIIKTTDAKNYFTQTEYNDLNKVSATIDAATNRTEYEFDDRGNPSKTIYPDLSFQTTTYDAEGNAITSTDRAGRITKTIYDKANRVTEVIMPDATPLDDADNPRTINEYDLGGRLISVTDARSNKTSYEYNNLNQRIKTIDANLDETTFDYNNLGRRTQSTDALGRKTKFEYNKLGNLTKTIFPDNTLGDDSDNLYTQTTYDNLSRKTTQRDLAGNISTYEYSDAGNLSAVIDAMSHRTEYEYDQRGNKTIQRDANQHETKWSYDELGRVQTHTLPNTQIESFTYDSRGNLKTKTDFNQDTTSYDYNNLNQLELTTYADTTTIAYTYYINGQIQTMTDANGITSYAYDEQSRLTHLDYPDGNFIEYQYDKNGNRTLLTTANQIIAYTFDALNRLETVTDSQGITTYTYDAVGNRATQVNSNGTTATYSYDLLNRLEDLIHKNASNSIIASYHYTLGANGNRQRIEEATGRIVDYSYDDIYRLETETITDPTNGNHFNQWSYDDVGNRLQQEKDGIVTTYTYNDNDQIQSETKGAQITSYTYDNNGNTLTKSIDATLDTTYSYNKDNRMVQAITPISTIINSYDAGGIRQSQSVDGVVTNYLIDQNRAYAQVIEEQNNLYIPQITYIYGDDLIKQTQGGATHTFGYDGLGSTRILTNDTGVVQNAYGYEAFGEVDYQLGTVPNNYLFTGEAYDNNVGFYYLRARFYNPSNGSFTQMDSFAGMAFEPKTLHKYLYANGNPSNVIDPSGKFGIGQVLATVSITGILVNFAIEVAFQGFSNALEGKSTTDINLGAAVLASMIPGKSLVTIFRTVKWAVKGKKAGGGFYRVIKGAADHEIDSVKHIAKTLGARVLHRGNAKGPDLIIKGLLWEMKRLKGTSKYAIDNNIRKALKNWKQVNRSNNRIIIDGRDVNLTKKLIQEGMSQVGNDRLRKVGQLKFILGDGKIIEWAL